jgi:hypothetical protein
VLADSAVSTSKIHQGTLFDRMVLHLLRKLYCTLKKLDAFVMIFEARICASQIDADQRFVEGVFVAAMVRKVEKEELQRVVELGLVLVADLCDTASSGLRSGEQSGAGA